MNAPATWQSFNGAATFRSRKGVRRAPRVAGRQGFNGAATFRSRKAAADMSTGAFVRQLQWGRDLSVAEGPSCRQKAARYTCGLQWGRDLSVAEGLFARVHGRSRTPLQWGRDLSVAEGPPHNRGLLPCACFNGAATFRSRKEGHHRQHEAHAHASMGPRPFGRGREISSGEICTEVCKLQWGRDLSVAEGCHAEIRRSMKARLQWGRDLSVAEGCFLLLAAVRLVGLQWGRDLSVAEGSAPS